jgi:phosphoglycolate phosphatase
MNRGRIIYFDFDGTLHDTSVIYRNAVQKAYDYLLELQELDEQKKIDYPKGRNTGFMNLQARQIKIIESSKWLGMSPEDMWKDFMPDLSKELRKQVSKLVGEEMLRQLDLGMGKLYDGTLDVLKQLKERGYSLKILSNCTEVYRNKVLEVFPLDGLIDDFIAAENYRYTPKFEIISQLEETSEVLLFIGDRKSDIDVGARLGIKTIACDYGFGIVEELKAATHHIGHIKEMLLHL